jgi:hypothetical protein
MSFLFVVGVVVVQALVGTAAVIDAREAVGVVIQNTSIAWLISDHADQPSLTLLALVELLYLQRVVEIPVETPRLDLEQSSF